MADQNGLSLSGAKVLAAANKTRMAACVMHLYKASFTPTPTSVLADYQAAECDFDGYAPATIATWADPVLAGQGYAVYAPTQTFRWDFDTDGIGNQVGGHWLQTAGGDLIDYSIYGPSIPCQGPDQAVVKTPVEVTPAGTF